MSLPERHSRFPPAKMAVRVSRVPGEQSPALVIRRHRRLYVSAPMLPR
jgi:ribosomal protein L36